MVVFSACVGNFISSASMNGIFRFLLAIHADVLKEALPLHVICVLVAHKPVFGRSGVAGCLLSIPSLQSGKTWEA